MGVDKIVYNFGYKGIDPGCRNKTTELNLCLGVSGLDLRVKRSETGRKTPWRLVFIQIGESGGGIEGVANSNIFFALH